MRQLPQFHRRLHQDSCAFNTWHTWLCGAEGAGEVGGRGARRHARARVVLPHAAVVALHHWLAVVIGGAAAALDLKAPGSQ